ncbi:MAG: hypothetical protein QOK22_2938, partial [Gaiellaceae bacterium]|nr:hypothetical protein [Gaiellaceae bacterium]
GGGPAPPPPDAATSGAYVWQIAAKSNWYST